MTNAAQQQPGPVAEFIGGSLTAKVTRTAFMPDEKGYPVIRYPLRWLDQTLNKQSLARPTNWTQYLSAAGGYYMTGLFSTLTIGLTFIAGLGAALAYPAITIFSALGLATSVNAATLAIAHTASLVIGGAMLAGGCTRMFGAPLLRGWQGKPASSLSPCARFCAGALDAVMLPIAAACALTGTTVGMLAAVTGGVVGGVVGIVSEGLMASGRLVSAGFKRFVAPIIFCQPVVNTANAAKRGIGNWLEHRAQQREQEAAAKAAKAAPLACPMRESRLDQSLAALGERVRRRFNPLTSPAQAGSATTPRPTASGKDPQP